MRHLLLQYWRVLACIAIVSHHTICALNGEWPALGHPIIEHISDSAKFMSIQAKMFGLCGFTFISGAVLYYASTKQVSFLRFLWAKVRRILFPLIFFALLYKCLFPDLVCLNTPTSINGTHLWYLPMIFLCMLITSLHFYKHYAMLYIAILYFAIIVIRNYIDFRTIEELYYYYPIFYSGFLSNYALHNTDKLKYRILHPTNIDKYLLCAAIVVVMLLHTKVFRLLGFVANIPAAIVYAILFIILSNNSTNINDLLTGEGFAEKISNIVNIIDRNSFAIYLMHQFFLNTWIVFGENW